jgi:hypothetical protein
VLAAHACYLGGRDQEDHGSKPAPSKQFERPYLKNTQYKTVLTKNKRTIKESVEDIGLGKEPLE